MRQPNAQQRRFIENAVFIAASHLLFSRLAQSNVPVLRLGDIAETASGGTPSRGIESFFGGDIPWIKSGDLTDGVIERVEEFITEEGLRNSSARIFPSGTVVIALYGATVGKTGILTFDAASNQAVCAVLPKTGLVSKDYLYWFLRHKRQDFIDASFGGAQPNISQKLLRDTSIPIPDISMQEAICEFFAAVIQLKSNRSCSLPNLPAPMDDVPFIIAHIDAIAEQIAAARGLRQSAVDEANKLLLSAISSCLHPFIDQCQPLAHVCKLITDGEHNTPSRIESVAIPLVTAKNVRDGYLDLSIIDYVDHQTAEQCWRRIKPQNCDILMVCVGATTGRVCQLIEPPDMVIVRSVALLRPDLESITPSYLQFVLKSEDCQSQIWQRIRQSAQPGLYQGQIKSLTIPLPSLSEQRRIVTYLESLQTEVDQLKRLQAETVSELDALLPSLLDRAFKGEL